MSSFVGDQLELSPTARALIASLLAVRQIAEIIAFHGGDLDLTLPIRRGGWTGVCEIATKFRPSEDASRRTPGSVDPDA